MNKLATTLLLVAASFSESCSLIHKAQKPEPRSVMELFRQTLPEVRISDWPFPVRRQPNILMYHVIGKQNNKTIVLTVSGPDPNKNSQLDETEVSDINLYVEEKNNEGFLIQESTKLEKWRDGAWNMTHKTAIIRSVFERAKTIEPLSELLGKDGGVENALRRFSEFLPRRAFEIKHKDPAQFNTL